MFDAKTKIKLDDKNDFSLFSKTAEEAARYIRYENAEEKQPTKSNKSTQIRKFYDELCMWEAKVNNINLKSFSKEERERKRLENYNECIPFIYMMKAKVAYALARKSNGTTLVNQNFSNVFNQCISEIKNPETLKRAKLFMEAVMGFYKLEELNNKG